MNHPFVELNQFPTLTDGAYDRASTLEDAPAMADILARCEAAVSGESSMTVEDFLGDWEGVDLANDTRGIFTADGTAVASLDFDNRANLIFSIYGYVHPDHRGKGYGSFLIAWAERRVKELAETHADPAARIVTRAYINEKDTSSRELFEAKGYAPIRVTFSMEIVLDERPEPVSFPDGITIRNFVPGVDDQIAYEAYEEAFADLWQRPRGTFEQFASKLRRGYFDPAGWFLAMAGDQVAGVLFSDKIDDNGWVEIVGVRRPWRGRGLAHSMLRHAFGSLHDRGVRSIGLSVDASSPTGAPQVYARAGMHQDQIYLLFERELRPGTLPVPESDEA